MFLLALPLIPASLCTGSSLIILLVIRVYKDGLSRLRLFESLIGEKGGNGVMLLSDYVISADTAATERTTV